MVVVAPQNSGSMMGISFSELLIGLSILVITFILFSIITLLFSKNVDNRKDK